MNSPQWIQVNNGATVGTAGTEGEIVQDHYLPGEAHTTLERATDRYALTVGIFGWMVHTIFLAEEESEGLYAEVQTELQRIVALIPDEDDATDETIAAVTDEITQFTERYY